MGAAMNPVLGLVFTLIGGLILAMVLRDLFHTLVHPSGQGRLTYSVMRGVWRLARRAGRRGMMLSGPAGVVAVIGVWTALTVLGWALVYLPSVPTGFSYSPGLEPGSRSAIIDAVYVALVDITTLGLGDIVPVFAPLRIAAPLAALMGFALVSAAVSWPLQLYPALGRRRALAVRLRNLQQGRTLAPDELQPTLPPPVTMHELAGAVAAVRVDFVQYTEMYFFHDDGEVALSAGLVTLLDLVDEADGVGSAELRFAASVLRLATEDLAQVLDRQYLRTGSTARDVVRRYASEHEQARDFGTGRT